MKTGLTRSFAWWAGMVILAFAGAYAVMLVVSGVKLKNAYASLQKNGRPMSAEVIIPEPVPDKDNAALLYKSAMALLKSAGDTWGKIDPDKFSGTNHEVFVKFLAEEKVVKALGLVDEAVGKPACRFDLDYTQGPGILLPHVAELRSLERILATKARIEIERGDNDALWKTIILGYKAADALHNEPLLISQLVRIAMFSIMDRVMMDACNMVSPTEAQAAALIPVIKPFADDNPMVVMMDSERLLLGEWVFKQPAAEIPKLISAGPNVSVITRVLCVAIFCKPSHQLMHASYLHIMNDLAKYMAAPYWEMDVSTSKKIEEGIPRWDIFSRLLVPAIGVAKTKQAILMAKARVSQTGFSLIRHKLAKGRFPATLTECDAKFLPVQPVDPFSGKPLIYRQEGNGFILYSIGENMKDDGGKPELRGEMKSEVREKKEWDLVWKYEGK